MRNVNIIKKHSLLELGKIPPQAIELEEAVIGAILLEKEALIEIIDIIKPESFYKDEHTKIYKSVIELFADNKPIDILTVLEKLRSSGELENVGGVAYLSGLTMKIGSGAHIEFHARIVQQKYIQRELIRASTEIQNSAFDESIDVEMLLDFSETQIFNIAQGNVSQDAKQAGEIGKTELVNLEELSKSDAEFSGLPSGLTAFDRITGGFQTKLYILAGRPSMGKSILSLVMARNMAVDFNIPVALFSLEMTGKEIWFRLIAIETGIESGKVSQGKFTADEWQKVESAQSRLESAPLYIDDTSSLTPIALRAKARRLKMKKDIKMVFIDYLQLMNANNLSSKEQEVSFITRSLKLLSKELDIPVMCLAQLNRAVESRPDRKPMLSDLRDSGAIEQDADMVSFIYRPEYYGFTEDENQVSTRNLIEILNPKNRGGRTGDVVVKRDNGFTNITDIETFQQIDDVVPLNNEDLTPNEIF